MRPLALLLLLASCGVLHAQDQERKLVDRILKPDMTLGNPMQTKAYYSGSSGSVDISKEANVKDFYFTQKFAPKSFDTKEFDSKSFWRGDFQFTTKAASMVKTAPAAEKTFETKAAACKGRPRSRQSLPGQRPRLRHPRVPRARQDLSEPPGRDV